MCCRGDGEIDTTALEKDKDISKQLASDRKRLLEEVRLLLLGAGESGKSTIAKQMKIIHLGGFNPEEKQEFITTIHTNIYESVQSIYRASEIFGIKFASNDNFLFGKFFLEPFSATCLTPEQGAAIEAFYQDDGVIQVLSRRSEFQLLDNTEYYVSSIRRITAKGYIPTELDVLNTRVQTTGVIETMFSVNGKKFIMVDVGGQRSERKKWMHCFENVSGVLFCVGISAFDQTLYEDNKTNRLHEALKLFHEICMSKWFTNTAIILFLNKEDLFRAKLSSGRNIKIAFPEYTGTTDFTESITYLQEKFLNVTDPVTGRVREVYPHVTTATDTNNVNVVFDGVKDFIMNQALRGCGLIT